MSMFAKRQSALAAAAGAPPAPRAKPSLKPVVAVLKMHRKLRQVGGIFEFNNLLHRRIGTANFDRFDWGR